MKLRRFTKLALAGTALAATAATLTTATYAWYVANSTASIGGLTSNVSSTTASENLLIADAYTATEAAASATVTENMPKGAFKAEITNLNYKVGNDLTPQTYFQTTESGEPATVTGYNMEHTPWDTTGAVGWKDNEGNAITSGNVKLFTFKVYLLATDKSTGDGTITVTPTFTIKNTTTSANIDSNSMKQTAYNATGSKNTGDQFIVDATNALHMAVLTQELTEGATPSLGAISVNNKNVDLGGVTHQLPNYTKTVSSETVSAYDDAAVGDANVYYYDVTQTKAYGTDLSTGASDVVSAQSLANITLNSGVKTLVTFHVWLEGTDASCFDSCKGQTFDISCEFAVNNN